MSTYDKLVAYINAATDLAEAAQADLKRKSKGSPIYSTSTILALNKFQKTALEMKNIIDHVNEKALKLN